LTINLKLFAQFAWIFFFNSKLRKRKLLRKCARNANCATLKKALSAALIAQLRKRPTLALTKGGARGWNQGALAIPNRNVVSDF